MSNLTNIPQVDWFETTLAQAWNGAVGTLYVNAIPWVTLPVGEKTYVTVDPWKTTQQVARVSAWTTGQITIDSITVKKGAWLNYTQQSHSVGAKVIISDNYQFWSDIKDAVNSKLDNNTDMAWDSATTFAWLKAKSLTTTQRDALTPSTGLIIYNSTAWALEQYIGGSWQSFATGTTPNASTTVAGKVEQATQAEVEAGTDAGGTGAVLFVSPSTMRPWGMTQVLPGVSDTAMISDASDSDKVKKILLTDIFSLSDALTFGTGQNWDVTITTTVTLTSDMFYRNLTITSPWVLDTNWFRVFCSWTFSWNGTIRRNWNAWSAWTSWSFPTWWAWGAALNQWTLNAEVWWAQWGTQSGAGGNWTTANPSYTTIPWKNWAAGANTYGSRPWGTGGVATQWTLYNVAYTFPQVLAFLTPASSISTESVAYLCSWWAAWWWGDWTPNTWSSGWGWGGNWWTVFIRANTINFTWLFECLWWNWGAWWSGFWTWWWGAWGNWWVIILIYRTHITSWTKTLTWWTGGWSWGQKWQDWNNWTTIMIQI